MNKYVNSTNTYLLFKHILQLEYKQQKNLFLIISFFIIIFILFFFTFNSEVLLLQQTIINICWISFIVSLVLSWVYQLDFFDSKVSLCFYYTSGTSVELLLFLYSIVHWLLWVFPVLILIFLIFLVFGFTLLDSLFLITSFCFGISTLNLVTMLINILVCKIKKNIALVYLLTVPLFIPILILSESCIHCYLSNLSNNTYLISLFFIYLLVQLSIPYIGGVFLKKVI